VRNVCHMLRRIQHFRFEFSLVVKQRLAHQRASTFSM
jgi:hypothetical protein